MAAFSILHPISFMQAIVDAWKYKHVQSEEVIKTSLQKGIQLGGSISYEELRELGMDEEQACEALRWCVENLGVTHLRIGYRWNKISIDETHRFNFSYYSRWSETLNQLCQQYDLAITLNIGPIKTFRWPEQHIPFWLLDSVHEKVINADSYIVQYAQDHMTQTLEYIEKNYPHLFVSISQLQLENELFNPFGTLAITMGMSYIESLVGCLPSSWADKRLLWNGSGLFDVPNCLTLIKRLSNRYPQLKHTLGYDYYYTHDVLYKHTWTRVLDHAVIYPLGISSTRLDAEISLLQEKNIDCMSEISEAQFELWGRARHPGSSVQELKWVLLRCMRYKSLHQSSMSLSLWGLERLAARVMGSSAYSSPYTPEKDQEIVEFIQKYNALSLAHTVLATSNNSD